MSKPRNMQSFIVWILARIAERETARKGDEALEGAEGNGDDFDIFRCAAHEDWAKVFCMPAICRDKVKLGMSRRHVGKR
jgi:hypothetical protein